VSEDEQDILQEFITESIENLQQAESQLLSIESGENPESIHIIFRAIHSVKGGAGFFELGKIELLSHEMEAVLDKIRSNEMYITQETISVLLQGVDALGDMLEAEDHGQSVETGSIVDQLKSFLQVQATQSPSSAAPPQPLQKATALAPSPKQYHWHLILRADDPDIERIHQRLFAYPNVVCHSALPLDGKEQFKDSVVYKIYSEVDLEMVAKLLEVPFEFFVPVHPQPAKEHIPASPPPAPCHAAQNTANSPSSQKKGSRASVSSSKKTSDIRSIQKKSKPVDSREARKSIRLDVSVLDTLLELVGEVVLSRNQFITRFENDPAFKGLSKSITKLHQHVIHTRMQPIGTIFDKYTRIVRDLAQKLGKKIDLHIEGGDIELDRTVLEALADPLTHLVRNAADNGIETPDVRSENGKSVMGNIYLRAHHESGQILIEVEDDGKGIDPEVLLDKAIEKGIVQAEEAAQMSGQEIVQLIFHPGFSTKEQTSEISGRGVGMDVVKNNLEKMGCIVEFSSTPGRGSILSARIQLTQAIVNSSVISALIIRINDYRLSIPQIAVNEIIRINREDFGTRIETINGQEVFKLRDQIIPLVHLEDLLDIQRTFYNPRTGSYQPDRRQSISGEAQVQHQDQTTSEQMKERRHTSLIFIVLKFKHNYFGILVDQIIGTEEIVVKRLPKLLKNRTVFAGGTILGNGDVALILDIKGMVQKAGLVFDTEKEVTLNSYIYRRRMKEDTQKLVIFSNAQDEYFAIPVNLLSEVDRFHNSEIKHVGDREFIKRHGRSLPLLRLEKLLKVSPIASSQQTCIVLVPSRVSYEMGIVASKIITTIDLTENLNTKEADEVGIMATFFYDDKLITLLDIYTLIHGSDPERYKNIIKDNIDDCRILVAEDQVFFRQLVAQYFKSYGVSKVTVVNDGQEALEELQARHSLYDVIVSDIEMPNMNGYELVASVKADPKLSKIPIMALTSLSGEKNVQKGMEAGFDKYEIKIDKERVVTAVAELYHAKMKSDLIGKSS